MKVFLPVAILIMATFPGLLNGQAFTPFPSNPIIPFTQPNPGVWNDPCVLKVNKEYWMYLTSPDGKTGPFEGNVLPYLMKSANGLNWTLTDSLPLLVNNSDPEAWDSKGIETPSVVFFNSWYHMYYTAIPEKGQPGQAAIGHATSKDGKVWSKDKIILTPSGIATDWKSYSVAEPGAVVYKNSIYLYFTGVGARQDTSYPGGQSVIGLFISEDGYTFKQPQKVLTQGPKYQPSRSYYGYSTPSAVVFGNIVHLYYDVVLENPQWHQTALHHAYSTDGINSFTEDDEAIFEKSDFLWTSREIRSPSVLLDSSKVKMWFAGDDFFNSGKFGIGYASAAIPVTGMTENRNTDAKGYYIFQDPFSKTIKIHTSEDLSQATCLIYDCTGKLVIEEKNISGKTMVLEQTQLTNGVYFIRVVEGSKVLFDDKIVVTGE